MTRKVRILRSAQRDLEEIALYVRTDDPGAAERILDDLLTHIERLAALPESAPLVRDERLRRLGYRALRRGRARRGRSEPRAEVSSVARDRYRLSRGRYLVFFKLVGSELRIYRVLHARRAHEQLL